MLGNLITSCIRRHDEDGIFTLDRLPLPISQSTLNHRDTQTPISSGNGLYIQIYIIVPNQSEFANEVNLYLVKEL